MGIDPQTLRENVRSKSVRKLNPHIFGKEVGTSEALRSAAAITTGETRIRTNTRKSVEERLNKTERRWLAELKHRGYAPIHIQAIPLQLGHDCRYTVDFVTPFELPLEESDEIVPLSPTAWEVKGFRRDDAMVKLRVAARIYSWIRFVLVEWKGQQWIETEIKP